jgi:glycosyltransferase involved in cell wall biosynthesis
MRCSVIIPLHNEEATVRSALPSFLDSLPAEVSGTLAEVLLVENGSTDGTREEAERLANRYPGLVRVSSIARPSYGSAIRHGIEQSAGSHLTILECDALSLSFLGESIRIFREQRASVIVGSKRHPRSLDRRPAARRLMTRGFNLLLRALIGYPGSDTHGLKSFEASLARHLCSLAVCGDEVFQTELVLLAWRLGHPVVELPVELEEIRPTPVRIMRRAPKVAPILWELRRSLSRFPPRAGRDTGVVSI